MAFTAMAVGAGKLAKAAATADGGAVHVHGSGTAFVEQVKPGDQLLVSAGACKGALAKVADVVSDELLVCAAPAFRGSDANPDATAADVKDAAFKVMPKVDQHDMYDAIYDALDDNGVIGIFPEGGSHDRSSLLPLKAGIAVMALGACAKHGEALRSRGRWRMRPRDRQRPCRECGHENDDAIDAPVDEVARSATAGRM